MRDLFDNLPEPPPKRAFDGATYEPERDHARLKGQLGRVFDFMRDGKWRSLQGIALVVGGSEAAVSARLRDLRKKKYGAFKVERRHVQNGFFQYRVRVEESNAQLERSASVASTDQASAGGAPGRIEHN